MSCGDDGGRPQMAFGRATDLPEISWIANSQRDSNQH